VVEITLSNQEMMVAAYAGCRRTVASRARGLVPEFGNNPLEIWGMDVEGAAGEMAAAKALNLYWDGAVNTFHRGDVGPIQIRTAIAHDRCLIVRDRDSDEDHFVLVTGLMPTFRIHGWIRGADAKRPEWLRAPQGRPPAWFVPQSELFSVQTLARFSEVG
jgi:hypothetical protein